MDLSKIRIAIGVLALVVAVVAFINLLMPKELDRQSFSDFYLGSEYFKKGDYESAIIAFSRVVKENPGYARGYFNLGCAYDAAGVVQKAIKYYKKAVELEPTYLAGYFNLGNIYDVLYHHLC